MVSLGPYIQQQAAIISLPDLLINILSSWGHIPTIVPTDQF